ncbi:hypothetical protein [Chitinophaga sp. HK235]|uniref:terpene synthase family protein n=1 Tax=Chitinophaga sp. HK235 TaxID=2952571 RepID=UPI001BAD346A|nr:hypothetical protein [Chitinophaga sp. HK235]
MRIYTIPRLYCPFTQYLKTYSSEITLAEHQIREHTSAWLLRCGLMNTMEELNHYEAQQFARMIAISYPNREVEDLKIWCDFNTLLFIVDDILDEEKNTLDKRQQVINFITDFIAVLENNSSSSVEDSAIFRALIDVWRRMRKRTTYAFQQKFIQSIRDMFAGGIWAYDHIANGRKPQLADYLENRQFLGAANFATDSLPFSAGVYIPANIYKYPPIHQLTLHCRNAICLSNDLFSLGKEKEFNADFNIVSILENTRGLTVNEAIKEAAVIHNAIVRDFVRIAKSVLIFDTDTNKMIRKYIHALCCLMAGNIVWSTENTTRYPHHYGYRTKVY